MRVKSLKKCVVRALYKDISSSLWAASAKSQPKKGKLAKKKKMKQVVMNIRDKLDEYLVGTYSPFRHELCDEFNNHIASKEKNLPDMDSFLNCILDDSFKSLEVTQEDFPPDLLTEEGKYYPVQLVETVSHHCPSLQMIHFTIGNWQLPRSSEQLWANALGSLSYLTVLKLTWDCPSDALQFFSHLGTCCPHLKCLKLRNLPFQLDQQLALVLGSSLLTTQDGKVEIIRGKHVGICHLQFPDVTPICHSLQHLSVKSPGNVSSEEQIASSAFLLRHLPQLQKSAVRFNWEQDFFIESTTSGAVQLLHNLSQLKNFVEEHGFLRRGRQRFKYSISPPGMNKTISFN